MKVCGSDKGRKGYKQRDRGLPTVADGELMLEGWSIVSSKEGRGEERNRSLPSSPCCSSPCYWGLNLGRRKGERACVHVGESLPPGLPASQNYPTPPPPPPPPPPPSHPISGNSALCKVGPGSSGIEKQSHTEMSFSHELEFNPTHRK